MLSERAFYKPGVSPRLSDARMKQCSAACPRNITYCEKTHPHLYLLDLKQRCDLAIGQGVSGMEGGKKEKGNGR